MSDTSGDGVKAVSATFAVLTAIVVPLRFWARRRQKAPLLADDWLMIPTLIAYVGAAATNFVGVDRKVLGHSNYDLSKDVLMDTADDSSKVQIAVSILLVLCLGCTKASALFFYKRIFCVAGRKATFNIIIICSIVIVALWTLAFEFLTGFQCGTHFTALWDGNYMKYCTISFPFLYGEAISDFLLDVWVLVLPIPAILRLHTTRRRKISFVGIFLLACVGIAASIAKMVVYIDIELAGKEAFVKYDTQRMVTKAFFYLTLETGISAVAVNLPSVWLVFASVSPDAVLRSVRSVVSLGSLGSNRSKRSQQENAEAMKSSPSVSSNLPLGGNPGESSAEAHAECFDLKALEEQRAQNGIQVRHSVEQSSGAGEVERS